MILTTRRNLALVLTLVLLTATFVIYASTFRSMAAVWFSSNSFLHGILILPMSAYLVWHKRSLWMRVPVKPTAIGILLLLISVLAWTVADLVSVQLVSQLAFIAMIGAVIWSVLGTRITQIVQFSLLYAFFAVPFGDFLIPTLMDWTAYFTVHALQITGIPVLREGHYFSLPSGNFEVVEACSGIRFLLVTAVLGLFFAHETYRSWTKRLVFVLLAVIAITVANGIRAYLVVLIAHLTDMKYGTGQDHIYLGWVIFLLVITLLFWFGRRYEDVAGDEASRGVRSKKGTPETGEKKYPVDIIVASAIVLAILVSGPALLDFSRQRVFESFSEPSLPVAKREWSGPAPVTFEYHPEFAGGSSIVAGQYVYRTQRIELHIIFYDKQQQGAELVGWQNKLFDANEWRRLRQGPVLIPDADGVEFQAQSILITNGRQTLRIWHWYDVGGYRTSDPRAVKLRQAWNTLTGNSQGDAAVVVVAPVAEFESADGSAAIGKFLHDNFSGIKRCLRPEDGHERSGCATSVSNSGVRKR